MSSPERLASLAIETWKLQTTLERVAGELAPDRARRLEAQLRYSRSQLERLLADDGLRLVSFDDQAFTAELPVSAVNAEDLAGEGALYVDQTLEPSVVADGSVVHLGKVILRGDLNVRRD